MLLIDSERNCKFCCRHNSKAADVIDGVVSRNSCSTDNNCHTIYYNTDNTQLEEFVYNAKRTAADLQAIGFNLLNVLVNLHNRQICHGNVRPSILVIYNNNETKILDDFLSNTDRKPMIDDLFGAACCLYYIVMGPITDIKVDSVVGGANVLASYQQHLFADLLNRMLNKSGVGYSTQSALIHPFFWSYEEISTYVTGVYPFLLLPFDFINDTFSRSNAYSNVNKRVRENLYNSVSIYIFVCVFLLIIDTFRHATT